MSRIASRVCSECVCIFPEPPSRPPLSSIHSPHGHYRGVSPSKAVCSFVRLIFHSRWERERRPRCRRFPCTALCGTRPRARVIQSSIDSYGRSSGPQANDRGEICVAPGVGVRKQGEQDGYVLAERGDESTGKHSEAGREWDGSYGYGRSRSPKWHVLALVLCVIGHPWNLVYAHPLSHSLPLIPPA